MIKKKKIIIGYDFLNEIGGLERVMFFMANCLSKKYDIEINFLFVNEKRKDEISNMLELNPKIKITQLYKDKIESISLTKGFLFGKDIKCDLIISNSFLFSKIANKNFKKKNIPYIVIMHHPPNFLYSAIDIKKWANNLPRFFAFILGKVLTKKLKKKDVNYIQDAKRVIVSSEYTKSRIKNIYNINPVIIYPPASNFFKPKNPKQMRGLLEKYNINEPFILSHGRIIPDKRPDLFLKTAEKLQNFNYKGKKLNFIISGDINKIMKNKLSEIIKKKNLINVKIIGKVSNEELIALYNIAEIFVVTAPKEDFGLTPIEAMACGCPVIAWDDKAGPNETIINGKNGVFANPYDINDMAEKIKLMLSKNFKVEKNGDILNSVKKFSEEKAKSKILEEVSELFREC